MTTSTCLHIVPAIWPQIDDVGDYALSLALYLRQSHGIQSRFIVCDPEWNGPNCVEGFIVRRLCLRNEAGIWASLAWAKEEPTSVLLHYSGHGYDRSGVPMWLFRGVRSWLNDRTGQSAGGVKRFSTVFHDLWSPSAKMWECNFFSRRMQKGIVARLHGYSNISITSTAGMQAVLDGIQPDKTLWLAAPSRVLAPDASKLARRRDARLQVAILGEKISRAATISAHANLLRTLEKKNLLGGAMLLGRGSILDGVPGSDVSLLGEFVAKERIQVRGDATPGDVSEALGRADLLLSHLNGESACRSSAFTAALAARCPAVLRSGKNAGPLRENEHFIASDDSHPSVRRFEQIATDEHLDRIATAGRLWYDRYADWNVVARKCQAAFL